MTIAAPGIFPLPNAAGKQGQILTAYVTGAGSLNPPVTTGAAPAAGEPSYWLAKPILPVSLTVGGVPAALDFVGTPTWSAGITQINFMIPPTAALGPQPVVVTVGGVASSPVTLTVTQ